MAVTKIQQNKKQEFNNLYVDNHHCLYRWLSKKLVCIHDAADYKCLRDTECYGTSYWVAPISILLQSTYNFDW